MSFSPDGKILAAGGSDGVMLLWNVAAPGSESPRYLKLIGSTIRSLSFSPDGKTLAVGTDGVSFGNRLGNLMLWEADLWPRRLVPGVPLQPVNLGDILRQAHLMHHSYGSFAWSPDGKIAAFFDDAG